MVIRLRTVAVTTDAPRLAFLAVVQEDVALSVVVAGDEVVRG